MSQPNRGVDAARHFEQTVVEAVFRAWAEDLVDRAALKPGDRVLDVGCGTGVVARAAAARLGGGGRVEGIDSSAPRIELARALAAEGGLAVAWQLGDATHMPYDDEAFDVVFCQQVLHLIPDRLSALREMRRVLAPGGRLLLSVWRAMEYSPGFLAFVSAVRLYVDPVEASRFGRNFSLGDESELRRLAEEAGFLDIEIVQETKTADFPSADDFIQYQLDVNERWDLSDESRAGLISEVRAGLQPYVEDGRLRFPRGAHVLSACRALS